MNELAEMKEIKLSPVDEALALIDESLGGLTDRQLVSAAEMTNLLLDVRSLITDQ